LASVGGVVYLAVGFAHLQDAREPRVAEVLPPSVAIAQPVTTQPAIVMAAPNTAAIDEMQKQINGMRQELAVVGQNYSQASTNYQDAQNKLNGLVAERDKLHAAFTDANARIKAMADARDEADRRAKAAELALNSKNGNTIQLTKTLDANKTELQQSEAQRTTLQNRVQQLQMELQAAQNRASQLSSQVESRPSQQLASEPVRAPAPAMVAPITPPVDAVPIPDRKPAAAGVPHAQADSSSIERLLASTGLDINRLLRFGAATAQGGPFIALNDTRAVDGNQKRLDELKNLAQGLPLASPLTSYQLESGFGGRVDPINHHGSFHPGLDMSAPYKTPVYSTGPGVVSFTGAKDGYGRVVEIDHGHGIVTRYAHLHRALVARGQKVGVHTEIGELGSTGRATGPHVHYEVLVDGSPLDPTKFMEAGKNVVQISGK
jgi:murein DD-endopeptidase MepM/ murein hydrolase activator NlpD